MTSQDVPFTPVAYFWRELSGSFEGFSHYMLIRTPADLTAPDLTVLLQSLIDRHDSLRMRLVPATEQLPQSLRLQRNEDVRAADRLRRVDLAGLTEDEAGGCVARHTRSAAQRIDAAAGVMMQAVWFDPGDRQPGKLLLVLDHLVVDGVSWGVLLTDLRSAWRSRNAQPAPGVSFQQWARHLQADAATKRSLPELTQWTETLEADDPPLADRPLDPAKDTMRTARHLTVTLEADQTAALLDTAPALLGCEVPDLLLTAFTLAVSDWRHRRSGIASDRVLITLEGRGRSSTVDGMDLSRTVGWLTNLVPVRLDLGGQDPAAVWAGGGPELRRSVARVRELLTRPPDNGVGFGVLRYLSDEGKTVLARLRRPQIGFNYLGRFPLRGGEDWAPESEGNLLGNGISPDVPVPHLFQVRAHVRDEPDGPQLTARWSWAGELFAEHELRDVAQTWTRALSLLLGKAG